ncbi:PKD domain-containing protein [Pseudochelatococcus lubricantis]
MPLIAQEDEVLTDPLALPKFAEPFVDIDEWRDVPVRHRYVHGGFKGTETLFSFYFPPEDQYRGRFFQHVTPAPGSEKLGQMAAPGLHNKVGFAIASGAYFVETNGGGSDREVTAYRANAACAAYSRIIAQNIYGGERPFGYIYGGSGGGYRSIGSMENTRGVWDGAVPYVIGSSMSLPNVFTVRLQAMRMLNPVFPQVIDALDPGGSGDAFAGLNDLQTSALREATRMGFPPHAWFGYRTMGIHGLAALYPGVLGSDPGYFTDFWTKPGYAGHDHPEHYQSDRVQFDTRIAAALTRTDAVEAGLIAAPDAASVGGVDNAFRGEAQDDQIVGFRLEQAPPAGLFLGGDLHKPDGGTVPLEHLNGDIVLLMMPETLQGNLPAVGDAVRVDNSNFLALETYHRHQVPGPDFVGWDQFRDGAGQPIYPQRRLISPGIVASAAGSVPTGRINGKMIVVASLLDREAFPWQADWYRKQAARHLGEAADDSFRLWFSENALHGDEAKLEDGSRVISYEGMLHQALRDLAAWVEDGIEPPASTGYRVEDAQIVPAITADERQGVQPLITLSTDLIKAKAGEEVNFEGRIAPPAGGGTPIAADWDFEGTGDYQPGKAGDTVQATHTYTRPGTYFVSLRGASRRNGDDGTPYAVLPNIARARVVVS